MAEIEGGLIWLSNWQEATVINLGDAVRLGDWAGMFVPTKLLVAHTGGKNLRQFESITQKEEGIAIDNC